MQLAVVRGTQLLGSRGPTTCRAICMSSPIARPSASHLRSKPTLSVQRSLAVPQETAAGGWPSFRAAGSSHLTQSASQNAKKMRQRHLQLPIQEQSLTCSICACRSSPPALRNCLPCSLFHPHHSTDPRKHAQPVQLCRAGPQLVTPAASSAAATATAAATAPPCSPTCSS